MEVEIFPESVLKISSIMEQFEGMEGDEIGDDENEIGEDDIGEVIGEDEIEDIEDIDHNSSFNIYPTQFGNELIDDNEYETHGVSFSFHFVPQFGKAF